MASKITKIVANFETQLASTITVGGTTGSLKLPVVDDDGVALTDGKYVMCADLGKSVEEHLLFDLVVSTGAMTNIKSVSRQGVETTGALRQHRSGSKVTLTNFANLLYISKLLMGEVPLDGANPLIYDVAPTFSNALQLATKGYIDDIAIAGSPNATPSTKGIGKVSVAPVDPLNPIFVGDNDTRLMTTDQKDAMVNAEGGPVNATNPVIAKDKMYADGISAQQTTDNANIVFGENDASGKKTKVYQSFKATKENIKEIVIKKSGVQATVVSLAGMTYEEVDYNSNSYIDDGIVSNNRRVRKVSIDGNTGWTDQYGRIKQTLSGLTNGVTYYIIYTVQVTVDTDLSFQLRNGGTTLRTISTSNGAQTTYVDSFVASGTTADITFGFYEASADSATGQFDLSSFMVSSSQQVPLSDLTLKIFADNAGNPNTGATLATKTITSAVWNALADQAEVTFTLASVLNVTKGATYWFEIAQTTGSATNYPSARSNSAGGYTDGLVKSWNTAQGFTTETGIDLYFKVRENPSGKLATLDSNGQVPQAILPVTALQSVVAISSATVQRLSTTVLTLTGSASTPDTKMKEIKVNVTGVVKVTCVAGAVSSVNYPYAIFKNGVNVANWTYGSGTTDETREVDVPVSYGDLIQFYFKGGGGNYSGLTADRFKNFSVSYDLVAPSAPVINLE